MKKYDRLPDEQLIRNLRAGESEIMDYIINKYKFVVRKKAKAMYLLGGESDDLIQEGMIGLFKAIRDYDVNQESSFQSFADLCISRQMYTAIKLSQRQKHIPLNSYISLYASGDENSEEVKSPLIDQLQTEKESNPEKLFIDKEYAKTIEQALKDKLSDLENKVLYLHLMGEDYRTIAKLLDKSPKSIDNALQRIKNKVFDLLQNI